MSIVHPPGTTSFVVGQTSSVKLKQMTMNDDSNDNVSGVNVIIVVPFVPQLKISIGILERRFLRFGCMLNLVT